MYEANSRFPNRFAGAPNTQIRITLNKYRRMNTRVNKTPIFDAVQDVLNLQSLEPVLS